MTRQSIAYRGSTFLQNVGDQAIYYANCKLFENKTIIPAKYADDSPIAMFGGGTLLPRALRPEKDLYGLDKKEFKFCMGIGVNDPNFYSSQKADFDLRYIAGKYNINLKNVISWKRPTHYMIDKISDILGDEWIFDMEYYYDEHFELIKKFDFDYITVRGPQSQRLLSNYDINSTIVGDPALYLKPQEYNSSKSNKVIVSLRYLGKDKWGSEKLVENIIKFCNQLEKDVIFLPFHYKDIPINKYAHKKVAGSQMKIAHHLQLEEILNELNSASVVVGERLHTSVLAACCYTPFISLAYRPKNFDFAESIDMSDHCLHNEKIEVTELRNLIQNIFSEYEKITESIEKSVEDKRSELNNFKNQIDREIEVF